VQINDGVYEDVSSITPVSSDTNRLTLSKCKIKSLNGLEKYTDLCHFSIWDCVWLGPMAVLPAMQNLTYFGITGLYMTQLDVNGLADLSILKIYRCTAIRKCWQRNGWHIAAGK